MPSTTLGFNGRQTRFRGKAIKKSPEWSGLLGKKLGMHNLGMDFQGGADWAEFLKIVEE